MGRTIRIGFASSEIQTTRHGVTFGGCAQYRCLLPARELQRAGHFVAVGHLTGKTSGEFMVRTPDGRDHDSLDLVVLQRYMHRLIARDIPKARATGQAIVNDVDDWFGGLPPSNHAFWSTHPDRNRNDNREIYLRQTLPRSTALTVSTDYLADRLGDLGVPVFVIPNAIDFERWTPVTQDRSEDFTAGWLGDVGYRAPGDLAQLRGVLAPWLARHPGSRFHHAGSKGPEDDHALIEGAGLWEVADQVRSSEQQPITKLPTMYRSFDVGLAPLEDSPFCRSKSNLKSLEMAACGIPHVCSDRPEYRALGAGFLAKRPGDWGKWLDVLRDPDVRLAESVRVRKVAKGHDIRDRYTAWEQAYGAILAGTLAGARS